MKKKVSVLVPVYGVEKYLKVFLDSLCQQTLNDVEFIIVNDASPDGSDEIIRSYIKKDNRIVYINKKINEGLYQARQDAFDIAQGEYVINLDSDDFIGPDFLSEMYKVAKKDNLEVVVSNVELVNESGLFIRNTKSRKYDNDIVFSKSNISSLLSTPYATWCRLFKRDLLVKNDYRYENGELYLTNFHFLEGVKSGVASKAVYYYRIRDNSMSSASNSSKKLRKNLSSSSVKLFNKQLSLKGVSSEFLNSYRLFNHLSFIKLSFVSSIYGCDYARFNHLKNTITSEFPITFKNVLESKNAMPRELLLFFFLEKLGLVPLMLYLKWRRIR